jgi:hypothetical protein
LCFGAWIITLKIMISSSICVVGNGRIPSFHNWIVFLGL